MPRVTFLPEGKSGEVPEGISLLEAAGMLGVELNQECGGVSSCSTCRVKIAEGSGTTSVLSEIKIDEREVLDREQLDGNYRLACQAKVRGDVVVVVPPPVKPLADKALPGSK
jgi:2Fe-2S ferredoxin